MSQACNYDHAWFAICRKSGLGALWARTCPEGSEIMSFICSPYIGQLGESGQNGTHNSYYLRHLHHVIGINSTKDGNIYWGQKGKQAKRNTLKDFFELFSPQHFPFGPASFHNEYSPTKSFVS